MFPSVNLQPEKMVTEDDTVYCAGGGMAWIDLSILLIERYCGHQIASDTAKSHVLDVSRTSQTVYASSRQRRFHTDKDIKAVQSFLERNLQNKCKLSDLAHQHNMTERTLIAASRTRATPRRASIYSHCVLNTQGNSSKRPVCRLRV